MTSQEGKKGFTKGTAYLTPRQVPARWRQRRSARPRPLPLPHRGSSFWRGGRGGVGQCLLPRAGVLLVRRGGAALLALQGGPAFGGVAEPPGRAERGAALQGVEGEQRARLEQMNAPDGDQAAGGPAGLLRVQGQVAQQVVPPPPALRACVGGAGVTGTLQQQRKGELWCEG